MSNDGEQIFNEYVTAMVGGQLFGLPIRRVQDVFLPDRLTRVPLASPDIAGLINLRGHMKARVDGGIGQSLSRRNETPMAIGVELGGESYGLLIDSVGEVMSLDAATLERNPINLDARLAAVSSGIYRLQEQLLLVLDVDRVLAIDASAAAA